MVLPIDINDILQKEVDSLLEIINLKKMFQYKNGLYLFENNFIEKPKIIVQHPSLNEFVWAYTKYPRYAKLILQKLVNEFQGVNEFQDPKNFDKTIQFHQTVVKLQIMLFNDDQKSLRQFYSFNNTFRKYKNSICQTLLPFMNSNIYNPQVQNLLGYIYSRGYGVESDVELAVKYYQMSADQNNILAMRNLAYFYKIGKGVQQNAIIASGLYLDARRIKRKSQSFFKK